MNISHSMITLTFICCPPTSLSLPSSLDSLWILVVAAFLVDSASLGNGTNAQTALIGQGERPVVGQPRDLLPHASSEPRAIYKSGKWHSYLLISYLMEMSPSFFCKLAIYQIISVPA